MDEDYNLNVKYRLNQKVIVKNGFLRSKKGIIRGFEIKTRNIDKETIRIVCYKVEFNLDDFNKTVLLEERNIQPSLF